MDNDSSNMQDLIRVGKITSCKPGSATARVVFENQDNKESFDLFIIVDKSLNDKCQHSYDVGEDVLCVFLPSGVEAGFIVGAYYPNGVSKPTGSADVEVKQFSDGTRIEYDRSSSKLNISCVGDVNVSCINANVKASTTKIDCPENTITGNLTVEQNLTIGGGLEAKNGNGTTTSIGGAVAFTGPTVTHNGKDIGNTHIHGGVLVGGDSTGVPE